MTLQANDCGTQADAGSPPALSLLSLLAQYNDLADVVIGYCLNEDDSETTASLRLSCGALCREVEQRITGARLRHPSELGSEYLEAALPCLSKLPRLAAVSIYPSYGLLGKDAAAKLRDLSATATQTRQRARLVGVGGAQPLSARLERLTLLVDTLSAGEVCELFIVPWPRLQELSFFRYDHLVRTVPAAAVAALASAPLPALQSLVLSQGITIDMAGLRALATGAWPSLKALVISCEGYRSGWDPSAVAALATALDPQLRRLHLGTIHAQYGQRRKWGGDGQALAGVSFPHLEHLDVERITDFDEAEAFALAQARWPVLTSLALGNRALTAEVAAALAANPGLTQLRVAATFRAPGCQQLSGHWPYLEKLDIKPGASRGDVIKLPDSARFPRVVKLCVALYKPEAATELVNASHGAWPRRLQELEIYIRNPSELAGTLTALASSHWPKLEALRCMHSWPNPNFDYTGLQEGMTEASAKFRAQCPVLREYRYVTPRSKMPYFY